MQINSAHRFSDPLRDWDRKELVIPNKAFITDQLINRTLADQTTRLVIPVGLAYGGDVELALKLMLDAAINNSTRIPGASMLTHLANSRVLHNSTSLALLECGQTTRHPESRQHPVFL